MARCAVCGTEGPAGARFCPGCGAALGAPALSRRRIATVLFCDVVDSTAAAEGSDAESVLQGAGKLLVGERARSDANITALWQITRFVVAAKERSEAAPA